MIMILQNFVHGKSVTRGFQPVSRAKATPRTSHVEHAFLAGEGKPQLGSPFQKTARPLRKLVSPACPSLFASPGSSRTVQHVCTDIMFSLLGLFVWLLPLLNVFVFNVFLQKACRGMWLSILVRETSSGGCQACLRGCYQACLPAAVMLQANVVLHRSSWTTFHCCWGIPRSGRILLNSLAEWMAQKKSKLYIYH